MPLAGRELAAHKLPRSLRCASPNCILYFGRREFLLCRGLRVAESYSEEKVKEIVRWDPASSQNLYPQAITRTLVTIQRSPGTLDACLGSTRSVCYVEKYY